MRAAAALVALLAAAGAAAAAAADFPVPAIPCEPRHYVCRRAPVAPVIDGALEAAAWGPAAWTEAFTDIERPARPAPRHATRAKLLWDDRFLYVGARLEEPDLWATLAQRDAVIYHDNDFEVFIDPDGDAHAYYELEINALGAVWDLLLLRPYRDGGPAVNAWDVAGLRAAVRLDGTLNDPSDRDAGWSVELAFPWAVLAECAGRPAPPRDGDLWRVNFSRVQWRLDVVDGAYAKRRDPATGRDLPEDNWVWSPQGLVAMHYPEMWGLVQFSTLPAGAGEVAPRPDPDAAARAALWRVYYAQKARAERGEPFLPDLALLGPGAAWPAGLRLAAAGGRFQASLPAAGGGRLAVDETGRLRSAGGED